MAGTSRRQLEAFYPVLSGNVASEWGFDAMATIDDKLHMSEQTTVQTVQGPVNFGTTNSHTFAGPVNFSSTIITPNSNNLTSLVTAEVTQLENIGAVTITAGQWGYLGAMDQEVYQTATVTFAGVDLVNTVQEFSTDTTLGDNSNTAVPTEQAVKTYTDLRALWDSDNSAITRYLSIGPETPLTNHPNNTQTWGYANTGTNVLNAEATCAVADGSLMFIPIHLPHNAIVTAFRVTLECSGGDGGSAVYAYMQRQVHSSGVASAMASTSTTGTKSEFSDTSISNATVDNGGYSYHLKFKAGYASGPTGTAKFYAAQIDYTVVRPQP